MGTALGDRVITSRHDYPTSASNDSVLMGIIRTMEQCSLGKDNGLWGCKGCRECAKCDRLLGGVIEVSILRFLLPSDREKFNERWGRFQRRLE